MDKFGFDKEAPTARKISARALHVQLGGADVRGAGGCCCRCCGLLSLVAVASTALSFLAPPTQRPLINPTCPRLAGWLAGESLARLLTRSGSFSWLSVSLGFALSCLLSPLGWRIELVLQLRFRLALISRELKCEREQNCCSPVAIWRQRKSSSVVLVWPRERVSQHSSTVRLLVRASVGWLRSLSVSLFTRRPLCCSAVRCDRATRELPRQGGIQAPRPPVRLRSPPASVQTRRACRVVSAALRACARPDSGSGADLSTQSVGSQPCSGPGVPARPLSRARLREARMRRGCKRVGSPTRWRLRRAALSARNRRQFGRQQQLPVPQPLLHACALDRLCAQVGAQSSARSPS